ncbi:MAG: hypothetical protein ACRD01_15930 [Terriglobales bacterium]
MEISLIKYASLKIIKYECYIVNTQRIFFISLYYHWFTDGVIWTAALRRPAAGAQVGDPHQGRWRANFATPTFAKTHQAQARSA